MKAPILFLCTLGTVFNLTAQVPHIIHYQGRVTVHNIVHQGEGRFRFALVNSNGLVTFWSNDGTSAQGSEPAAAVSLLVNKGSYAVGLGDTTLPNMAAISPTVFTNTDVRLRVWFDDGAHGSQLLTPDQRIASVSYAMVAATVSPGGVTASSLAPGSALANLLAGGQSPVPGGGIVLSRDANSAALLAAGYVNTGSLTASTPEHWETRSTILSARQQHSAVWTGTRMIVWGGGGNGNYYNTGGRYNPNNDSWEPVSSLNAPGGRWELGAVWTGQEMLVWGGRPAFFHTEGNLGDGGRYDPATDSWRPISSTNAPSPRSKLTAVWTGIEMLVWGGVADGGICLSNGGRYNPITDTWTPINTNGAPSARGDHVAVWTGSEMIVWGGFFGEGINPSESLSTGARYNPVTDQWTPLPTKGAPPPAADPVMVWTGQEMIVWGGVDFAGRTQSGDRPTLATGARYDPVADVWRPITTNNVPTGRSALPAVWTGSEMVIWGGVSVPPSGGNSTLSDGARYSPASDTWTALTNDNSPPPRVNHTMVWTGQAALIFGGYSNGDLNSTHAWISGRGLYLYERQ